MPLSAQLASLSDPALISDNFFGFCEAAWSCLAVGGAHSELVERTGWVGWGGGAPVGGEYGFFSPFQSNKKALRIAGDACYHICFLCFH